MQTYSTESFIHRIAVEEYSPNGVYEAVHFDLKTPIQIRSSSIDKVKLG